ncbi:hypothetical protein HMPREF9406_0775 [Clostridium sp. HGF2]|nr:hypothetical protein HMPREF9406_0775 [Clostridium sp. HGF2]
MKEKIRNKDKRKEYVLQKKKGYNLDDQSMISQNSLKKFINCG